MNSLRFTPDQTIYYSYDPSTDSLIIRLEPERRPTEEEALADMPLVHLSRDVRSGEVVGLSVRGVQELLLQTLVRSLVEQTQGYFGAAAPTPAPLDEAPQPAADMEESQASDEVLAEESAPLTEEARLSRAARRRNRRRRKRALGTQPDGDLAALPLADEDDGADLGEVEEETPSPAEVEAEAARTLEAEPPAAEAAAVSEPPVADASELEAAPPPDAEAAPPAPKRGRGRKKAAEPEPAPAEEVPTVVEAVAPEMPAPPKRGRGRKKAAEPEAEAATEAPAPEAAAEEAAPAPKRGRGRKKAADATPEEAPEPAVAEADSTTEEAKPKRGRSRKKATEPEAEAEPAEATAPKRGRGRKKAADAEAEAESPEEAAAEAEAPAKPKRGRGRKKATEEETAPVEESNVALEGLEPELLPVDLDLEEEPEAEGEESTAGVLGESEEGEERPSRPTRRRSRRRKGKGEAEAVATPPPPVAPVEEAASEADEEKTGKRKRRRRKKRGKGLEAAATTTPTETPAATPQPTPPVAASQPAARRRDEGEGEEEEGPRRSYKTAPIPGLDAPEAFAFMKLDPLLGQAIAAMGFEEPTPIQRRAVPEALKGLDVIGLAQTGTGKTLAFLMPGLQRIVAGKAKDHKTRMLVLTPTRELALQVAEEAEYLATHTDIRISTVYGGVGFKQQTSELKAGADVIVATPGRLLDHLKRGTMRLDSVEVLVLDEADRMLDMGFLPEIRNVLRQLPKKRQTLLFSATMPTAIQSLSMDFQQDPVLVEVARQLPPDSIDQRLYPVEKHLKLPLLVHLLQSDEGMRSVLVFTETKSEADVVARKLQEAALPVALMHGDRNQREREEALQKLRSGAVRVLVATNVAARGLDIYDISHVINYDVPQTVDDYVHRIGRTARGEAEGKAYTFATSGDVGMIMRIESALEKSLPRERAETFNYEVPTPSWAKPSAEELLDSLHKPKGLADRFSKMLRRR